jgi:hypothetical protein
MKSQQNQRAFRRWLLETSLYDGLLGQQIVTIRDGSLT